MKDENTKGKLKRILSEYKKEKANGIETARRIDELVGGINGLVYKSGICFSIDDGNNKYPLNLNGFAEKKIKKLERDLVPCLHLMRTEHGQGNGSEVHISKSCSTKHYKEGFDDLVRGVIINYNYQDSGEKK